MSPWERDFPEKALWEGGGDYWWAAQAGPRQAWLHPSPALGGPGPATDQSRGDLGSALGWVLFAKLFFFLFPHSTVSCRLFSFRPSRGSPRTRSCDDARRSLPWWGTPSSRAARLCFTTFFLARSLARVVLWAHNSRPPAARPARFCQRLSSWSDDWEIPWTTIPFKCIHAFREGECVFCHMPGDIPRLPVCGKRDQPLAPQLNHPG